MHRKDNARLIANYSSKNRDASLRLSITMAIYALFARQINGVLATAVTPAVFENFVI
jgi:hypothetical protein